MTPPSTGDDHPEPSLGELRAAQEEFRVLLQSAAPEARWQSLFAKSPYLLSRALPLKLLPCDILPLGRPGASEPDFVIYPGSSKSQPIHGLIELKTSTSRIFSSPRRHIVKLSESASTAVAQLRSYDQGYNRFSPVPRVLSLSGRSHLFVIIGMSHELYRLRDEMPSYFGAGLADDVRLLTFDELIANFERSLPSSTSILIPQWDEVNSRVASLLTSSALADAAVADVRLFERLIRDNLFVKRFVCEFYKSSVARHARYDLGSASRRFYERHRFGQLLEEYELGKLDSNLWDTELDVYLDIDLTPRGILMRNLLLELIPKSEFDTIAEEGWYHSCGRTATEYVAVIKREGWGSI
jgi:hypothetical protein